MRLGFGIRDSGQGNVVTLDEGILDFLEEEPTMYQAVTRFEDLEAWQQARRLATSIYQLTRETGLRRDAALTSQMQRAAVSVMSNIAEGRERGSSREFHRFLSIALGSCAELRAQLYIARDVGYIDDTSFQQLAEQALRASQLTGALRASIARRISAQSNGKPR
jgi:four helix bundle protein